MTDAELAAVLHSLGIDEESCGAVVLLPLVQVAWADGRVQDEERELILSIASARGLLTGDGERLLDGWLHYRPSPRYIERGRAALIELAKRGDGPVASGVGDIVSLCEQVARSAGGLFGRIGVVDATERRALAEIAGALSIEAGRSWREVLDQIGPTATPDEDPEEEVTDVAGLGARSADVPHDFVVRRRVSVLDDGEEEDTFDGPNPARGGARLVLLALDGREIQIVLREATFEIGRWPDNDLQIRWDGQVSRQHCRFLRRGDSWYVADCGSSNGTFVNGEQVLERRLFGGEAVTIGETRLRFEST